MTATRVLLPLLVVTLVGAAPSSLPAAADRALPPALRSPRLSLGAFAPDGTTVLHEVVERPGRPGLEIRPLGTHRPG